MPEVTSSGSWDSYSDRGSSRRPIVRLVEDILLPNLRYNIEVVDAAGSERAPVSNNSSRMVIWCWSQKSDQFGKLLQPPRYLGQPNPTFGNNNKSWAPTNVGRTIMDPFTGFPLAELCNERNLYILIPIATKWNNARATTMRYILWETLVLLGYKNRAWLAEQLKTIKGHEGLERAVEQFSQSTRDSHQRELNQASSAYEQSQGVLLKYLRSLRKIAEQLEYNQGRLNGLSRSRDELKERIAGEIREIANLAGVNRVYVDRKRLCVEYVPGGGRDSLTIQLPLTADGDLALVIGSHMTAAFKDLSVLTAVEELLREYEFAAAVAMITESYTTDLVVTQK